MDMDVGGSIKIDNGDGGCGINIIAVTLGKDLSIKNKEGTFAKTYPMPDQ